MESSEKEESLSSLSEFQELLREWEAEHGQQNYDPTSLLERMAEILEREANVYMASDPGTESGHWAGSGPNLIHNPRSLRGETSLPRGPRLSVWAHSEGLLQEGESSSRRVRSVHEGQLLHQVGSRPDQLQPERGGLPAGLGHPPRARGIY